MVEAQEIQTRAQLTLTAPRTSIVIVNYRTSDHVITCLRSLEAEVAELPDAEVIVVDNASGDESVSKLRSFIDESGYASWARVIAHDANGGFAAGNNVAIRADLKSESPAEFYYILNPDTWIHPGAVTRLSEYLATHPDIGIAGSRLEDEDGSAQSSFFRFYGLLSEFNSGCRLGIVSALLSRFATTPPPRDETHAVDWVSGASMMVRRQVFEQVGLMDERFFLYFEEADLQLRANRCGWKVAHVHEASVVHLMGKATGVTGDAEKERPRPRYWFESRRHYFRSNYGSLYAILIDLVWFSGFSLWRVRRAIQRKPDMDPPQLWRDFLRYSLLGKR